MALIKQTDARRTNAGCHCWLVQQCCDVGTRFTLLDKPAVAPVFVALMLLFLAHPLLAQQRRNSLRPAAVPDQPMQAMRGTPTPAGRPQQSPTPAAPQHRPTPATRQGQAQRNVPSRAPSANAKASVLKAYELTRTASSEADCNRVIDLCKTGLQQGLDDEMAIYARRLSAWGYNRRGEIFADAGKTGAAFEDFESAVALDLNSWRAVHNRGVCRAVQGQYEAAVADFTRTIELNPNFPNAWFNRGEMHYELRKYADAVQDYTEAIHQNPRDAAAHNSRGHAFYRMKQTVEALADYEQAIQLDPAGAAAYVNRGDLLADQGKFAEAAKDYQQAIKANPSLGRAYQSAAWLMATCPDDKIRNAELALQAAKKAVALDGDKDYRYLETLAAAQANVGDFKNAVITQQKAMALAPKAIAEVYKGRIEKFRSGQAHREPLINFAKSPASRGSR